MGCPCKFTRRCIALSIRVVNALSLKQPAKMASLSPNLEGCSSSPEPLLEPGVDQVPCGHGHRAPMGVGVQNSSSPLSSICASTPSSRAHDSDRGLDKGHEHRPSRWPCPCVFLPLSPSPSPRLGLSPTAGQDRGGRGSIQATSLATTAML